MIWIRYSLGFLISLALTSPAFGQSASDFRAKLQLGEYAAAFAEAKISETADGQAHAAEALLSEIMLGQAKKNKKQAKLARKFAEAALEIDPDHQNARLQYAIADGFITRESGDVSAWMKKLPQKTYAIVQGYRDDFPEDPRGDALMGAWHLAIARKAGNKNAKKWFKASIDQGRALFLNASNKESNDAVIGVNYAFALLALQDDDFSDMEEVRLILTEVTALTPTDYLGKTLQAYGLAALNRLEDHEAVEAYAEMFLDGKVPSF